MQGQINMNVTIIRFKSTKNSTISLLYIGDEFECFVLEDVYHEDKIAGKTRIPYGGYKVGLRTEGGFTTKYAKKFPDMHEGMLEVLNVPNFEYILIHIGNYHTNTEGCILVGTGVILQGTGDYMLTDSTEAYKQLYPKLVDYAKNGSLFINIIDKER